MAYDKTNKKLYVTEDSGITPWEIAQCLDDYRVNTKGQRDVGMLCTSPNINECSLIKPYRHSSINPTKEDRDRARYGWNVKPKSSSETMASYLNKLKANGDGVPYWEYQRPRGGTELYRVLDFDGYNHLEKYYGTKVDIKRLTQKTIGIQGNVQYVTLNKNSNTYGEYVTGSFLGFTAIVLRIKVEKISPASTSNYNWYVDGTFNVSVETDTSLLAGESWTIYSDGNDVPTQIFQFQHDLAKSDNCVIRYNWNVDNYSYFGQNEEYFDIELKITTEVAYTLAVGESGREGIRYSKQYIDWDVRNALFDSGTKEILVVELTDGTNTERKMMRGLNVPADFVFSRAGFSQSIIDSHTSIYLYMLSGKVADIFGEGYDINDDYADLSAADRHILIPYPIPYNDVTKQSTIPTFGFNADDFQSISYIMSDGSTHIATSLTEDGVNFKSSEDVEYFTFRQNIYFSNVTEEHRATMTIKVYSIAAYGYFLEQEGEQSKIILKDRSETFEVECAGHASHPEDTYITIMLDVDGEIYYLHPYTQILSREEPEPYALGIA